MAKSEVPEQPRPSYEEGKVRDPALMQGRPEGVERSVFLELVKKASISKTGSVADLSRGIKPQPLR